MRSREQRRAAHALEQVQALEKEQAEFKSRYRAYVDRLPPTIVMSGLGQALATELAASGGDPKSPDQRAHRRLYDSLQSWLCHPDDGVYPGAKSLLQALVENDEQHYLRAQAEALAWLEWHKKFCRASFSSAKEAD